MPHEPQFAGSVLVSTHAPLHSIVGCTQAKSHMPETHVGVALSGAVHTLPHEPQLDVLLEVSTHEPSQFVPLPQETPHLPAAHTSAAPQTFAQSPQCPASELKSTHFPAHSV